MKKTALKLSLLLGLVAGCLTGCKDVKELKDNTGSQVIFTVDGVNVTADDILGFKTGENADYNFLDTDEGVKAVYNAIYNALAQKNVEITNSIKAAVDEQMEAWEDEVEDYASDNGVTERNARETKLEELGFEDEDELRAYYTIEKQKEGLEDLYESDYLEPKADTDTGTLLQRYVEATAPMIVRHILVSVSDSSTIHSLANITTTEVENLTSAFKRLALGKVARNSFKQVAIDLSSDGSSEKGGNLGIVDKYTLFVNEFKLGLYVHEVKENTSYTEEQKELLIPAEARAELEAGGVYENIAKINVAAIGSVLAFVSEDVAKAEQAAKGHEKVSEYDDDLYPRNVVYNYFLNTPAIKYLTVNTDCESEIKDILALCYPSLGATEIAAKAAEVMASEYFQAFVTGAQNASMDGLGRVVADDNEEPIIVAKSNYGFHFMNVTKETLGTENAWKFFTTGTLSDSTTYYKGTDYNFGYTSISSAKSARKSEIKDRVINFIEGKYNQMSADASLYTYEIFNTFDSISGLSVKENLKTEINNYIKNQQTIKAETIAQTFEDDWTSYIDSIKACNEMHDIRY